MPAGDNSRIQTMFHQQTDRVKFIRNLIKTSQMCKIKTRNTKSVQAPLHQIKKKKRELLPFLIISCLRTAWAIFYS